MLDQSFSAENFNLLFLKENRKGNFRSKHFNKEYYQKHQEFKDVLKEKYDFIKAKRPAKLTKDEYSDFADRLEKINQEKEEIRLEIFSAFTEELRDSTFQFDIEFDSKRDFFTIDSENGAAFYTIKQLQHNVNKTFGVIQSSRNRIVNQLYNTISDNYPKVIVKTDIRGFYESIPQDRLLDKVENNSLLTPFSKKLIRKLFYEFETKKDTGTIDPGKGLPRGIGLSAYLSELYMRQIDDSIKALPDLVYYARYVDDMVLVFCPKTKSSAGDYIAQVRRIVESEGLKLKDGADGGENKTKRIDRWIEPIISPPKNFDFLGYAFHVAHKRTKIEISSNKERKYKKRITALIDAYNKGSKHNEKRERKLLFERLKFLTGNFHLNNNKREVKSGIFYSNEMLSLNTLPFKSLDRLDNFLHRELDKLAPYSKLTIKKENLIQHTRERFNFKKGFYEKEKNFYSFNLTDKENAYYKKKYGKEVTAFQVIKSIWK